MTVESYKVRTDVRYRLIREEAVVLKQEEGETLVLNEVASRILQLLEEEKSVEEIAELLLAEFEVEPEDLLADVASFTTELVEAGIVEPVELER